MHQNPTRDNDPDRQSRVQLTMVWLKAQPVIAAYIGSAVRDVQHAEDLLQETALAVAVSFDQYDADRPFLPWAMGIARHKLLRYYREHGKDRLVFDGELLNQIGERMESQAEAIQFRSDALKRCMEKLASHAMQMIRMRYMQGMDYQRISAATGRTVAGVANSLHRSRKALAECVKREYAKSMGGAG
ncbi:MAG: sigma-70 family RNA polymerase sigma factor [Phycisphaeraceae bacterium]